MGKLAVYPGSFDPITFGHLDLLERALGSFDRIVVAVASNPGKNPLFTPGERIELVHAALEKHPRKSRVDVDTFQGLLVNYAREIKANAIVRGLRAVSDFEYEFQMALMNRKLAGEMETLFLMTGMEWIYLSSSLVKHVAMSGGCVKGLVPEAVERKLLEKFSATGFAASIEERHPRPEKKNGSAVHAFTLPGILADDPVGEKWHIALQ